MDCKTSWQTQWSDWLVEAAQVALSHLGAGEVAGYIPALRSVSPDQFGIAVASLDGEIASYGDANTRFSIQSLSKVFLLALGCKTWGDDVWRRVGQLPSTNPFNSLIELELERGIPRNPFLNSGALALADCLVSRHVNTEAAVVSLLRKLSGSCDLDYNQVVARSEFQCSERNLAAAYLMKSYDNFDNPVPDVLRAYCATCAIEASCVELARAGRFLANQGVCVESGEQVVSQRTAQQLCALMATTGTYEHSGKTAVTIGLPAKSGVGGGVLAVIPGKGTICVWSPRLDTTGNSVRAMVALEYLSKAAGLSVFG